MPFSPEGKAFRTKVIRWRGSIASTRSQILGSLQRDWAYRMMLVEFEKLNTAGPS